MEPWIKDVYYRICKQKINPDRLYYLSRDSSLINTTYDLTHNNDIPKLKDWLKNGAVD